MSFNSTGNFGRGGNHSVAHTPKCSNCKVADLGKKNASGLCGECYRNRNMHNSDTGSGALTGAASSGNIENNDMDIIMSHMGVKWKDLEQVKMPDDNWLEKPISEVSMGQYLKVVASTVYASHEHLRLQINEINEELHKTAEEGKKLSEENKKMNEKLKLQDARVKSLEESSKKMKTIITKQQSLIVQHDRSARSKRLIVCGIPEEEWQLHGETGKTEVQKMELVLNYLHKREIRPVYAKRVGNPDQGPQKRPRYLLVEFKDKIERNEVMDAASLLKEDDETKKLRIKSDLTKAEREEYTRLYKEKEKIESNDNNATVVIEKGKLLVNGSVVDQLKFNSSLF